MTRSETHTFENTLVAVVDSEEQADESASRLGAAGYLVEVLYGRVGKEHIKGAPEEGLLAALKKAANVLGDQQRITGELEKSIEEGSYVVTVDIDEKDPADAVHILKENQAHYIWRFDDWTYTRVATQDEPEPESTRESGQ